MSERRNRIEWIDVVKYICIMSVMVSHLESNTRLLSAIYMPFYLAMFFFSSGYVYRHKTGFKEFLIHKVRGLFIPWLLLSVFNIFLSQILSFNEQGSLWEELKWNFLQIRAKGDEVWFVAALFAAFIPFYFLIDRFENNGNKNRRRTFALTVSLAAMYICSVAYTSCMDPTYFPWGSTALPWHIEYIPQALFFMWLGYLFKGRNEELFDIQISRIPFAVVTAVYLILAYVPVVSRLDATLPLGLVYEHLLKLAGSLWLIALAKRIKTNRYISYVGSNTLIYFALHGKVYSLGQFIIKRLIPGIYAVVLNSMVVSSIFAVGFTVLISLVLIIPAYIINRWFPFLIGRGGNGCNMFPKEHINRKG